MMMEQLRALPFDPLKPDPRTGALSNGSGTSGPTLLSIIIRNLYCGNKFFDSSRKNWERRPIVPPRRMPVDQRFTT
jgi:hypothetical protein